MSARYRCWQHGHRVVVHGRVFPAIPPSRACRLTGFETWMGWALAEAVAAPSTGDVPVGAVVVDPGGRVIGRGHNAREAAQDPTAHAELLALRAAAATLGSWRLADC